MPHSQNQAFAFEAICEAHHHMLVRLRAFQRKAAPEESHLGAILMSNAARLEANAIDLLGDVEDFEPFRNAAISSFSSRLAKCLPEAKPGTITLPEGFIAPLFEAVSPAELSTLISRGLGIKHTVVTVFKVLKGMSLSDPALSRDFALVIAREIAPVECASYGQRNFPLWDDYEVSELKTPLFGPYMSAQVQAFPSQTQRAIRRAAGEDDLTALVRFHLAGAPTEYFDPEYATSQRIRHFFGAITTNHGRMKIREITGNLETFLANGQHFDWP